MIAFLGGGAAAAMWASSTLAASRSTRIIGSQEALAWVMVIGLVLCAAAAPVAGVPHAGAGAWAWSALSGVGSTLGLSFVYRALRIGKVGVVSPIAACEGGLAAVLSIAALGEHVSAAVAVALAVMVAGVVVVTYRGEGGGVPGRVVLFASLAAVSFAVGLVASSQAGGVLGAVWTILVARIVGVGAIAAPLALRGRLARPGGAAPYVALSGLAEVLGFAAYIGGSRASVAISAVLGSQFAALAALGSFVLFGERLTRRQVAGTAGILAGVAALAALRA
jgi:uncharacterized membrane protein